MEFSIYTDGMCPFGTECHVGTCRVIGKQQRWLTGMAAPP